MKTSSLSAFALLLVCVLCAQACATATEVPETTTKKDSGLGVDTGTGLDETGDELDGGSTLDSGSAVDFGTTIDTGATTDTGAATEGGLMCANTCSVNTDCDVCASYVGQTACCDTMTGACYYVSGTDVACPGSTTTPDGGTSGS